MKSIPRFEIRTTRTPIEAPALAHKRSIHAPEDVGELAWALLRDEAVECFLIFALNARHRVLGYHEVGRGGRTSCGVDLPSILRFVLLSGAETFIACHNHPSGDPSPSEADNFLTSRIQRAAQLCGLEFLDHIIVASGAPDAAMRWYSYQQSHNQAIAKTLGARELAAERRF